MIEHTYRCDLCGNQTRDVPESQSRPGRRVKYRAENRELVLCRLDDAQASEKVLCGPCLNGLSAAIASDAKYGPK
jgi:hypothetical protein